MPTPHQPRENGLPRTPTRSNTSTSLKSNNDDSASPLPDYTLGDCLGKGAFGSVYRALNWGTGETVAVKQVRLADLPKTELRVIMLEIDLLKNLNHENIVKYRGFVKTSDSLYIIMEYCENGSLHSICKNFGKFPENLVSLYMNQVLHGLLYLHDQGVIHRDIKGANILTTKEGLVKLADFGVATRTGGLSDSSVVGTPYWMAPEVIELAGASTASDIWSVGCTVIELLDGKPPYHKLASMPALFRIVNDDHPPLPEGASPAVRDFLMQCFQKDPNLRVSARKLLKHPWIVNARRSVSVVQQPTSTKYEEAVQNIQRWNEKLNEVVKSPNTSTAKREARQSHFNPNHPNLAIPRRHQNELSAPVKGNLVLQNKAPYNTDAFRSPEQLEDNWDDDFATCISPSALQLPHMKPHDNFAGLLSSDRLKAFANAESPNDTWNDDFEGDITIKSPPRNQGGMLPFGNNAGRSNLGLDTDMDDPMQTIRPLYHQNSSNRSSTSDLEGLQHIPESPGQTPTKQNGHGKHDLPRQMKQKRLALPSRAALRYKEDSSDDYSEAFGGNDQMFAQKVASMTRGSNHSQRRSIDIESQPKQRDNTLSPRLFHPSDLETLPRSASSSQAGSLRRHKHTRSSGVDKEAQSMRRSRSTLEIHKYSEADGEEDYSDVFGRDAVSETYDSDVSADELMLPPRLNSNWYGEEETDDDDPFAQLEEGFDEMDLEANIVRDKYARLCLQVDNLVNSLKTTQPDDELDRIATQLLEILMESFDCKDNIIGAHGMLPILEVLETCKKREVILKLLRIVNAITFDDVEVQENLCFVGGIPIITKFASKKYPSNIRLEAAAFVRQMYTTSTLTLQMFVSCGGLNVLVEFLEEDYEAQKDLVLIGINGIWSVFELQGPTPKNDFCRIFARSSVLQPLSMALVHVIEQGDDIADHCVERIVNIFYIFSQAENQVKETIAERSVLKRVLKDLKRLEPTHQITMLKFIKNLSMLTATLEKLQNANAIEVLTDLLEASRHGSHFREISNQILNTMYNLCKLSKSRQEDAAIMGLIPILQKIVSTERPLKEFALPILCDMAHCSKITRKSLWQHNGLAFYISLLSDPYWQVTALEAIFVWLQEETGRVEEKLLSESFTTAIIKCFTTSKANAFENLLEPLRGLLRLSPQIAHAIAKPELFDRILSKLTHHKAVVRLNLLRILRTICDASDQKEGLIRQYGMTQTIQKLAERDGAILVSNLAGELLKLPPTQQKSMSTTSRRVHKRGSSSVSSGSTVVGSPTNSTTLLNPLIYYDTKERIGLENTGSLESKGGRGSARMSDMGSGGSGGGGSGNRRMYRGSSVLRAPSQPNPPSPRIGSRAPSFVGDLGGN
ncbi:hypothetical protein DFH27DRAFT_152367 [Peziza echinospora]|nr:hypothetical protein DFH27DRAFT_152367 [Peziza echinospora]